MNKLTRIVGAVGLALVVAAGPISSAALAANPALAQTTLRQFQAARASMLADCKVDILKNQFGEVSCKGVRKTAGEAWDNALTNAGFPDTAQERNKLGRDIGLDETDGFTILGRANPDAVTRLMSNLERISAGK